MPAIYRIRADGQEPVSPDGADVDLVPRRVEADHLAANVIKLFTAVITSLSA